MPSGSKSERGDIDRAADVGAVTFGAFGSGRSDRAVLIGPFCGAVLREGVR